MARIRIDWQRIRQLPAEDVIVLLDRQAAGVLLSIMHIFEWEALFRVDDYDYADWDYLQEILSSAEEAIGNPLRLADLIPALESIASSIDALYCCDTGAVDLTNGDQYTDKVTEDETDGVPQNLVDAGYATDIDDWDGYYDYKCMVANVFLDNVIRATGEYEEMVETAGSYLGVIGAIGLIAGSLFSGGGLLILAGVATALGAVTALYDDIQLVAEGFFDNIGTDLAANRADLIEALYCGDGPSGSYAAFLDAADDILNPTESTALRLFNGEAWLKALYGGRYNQEDVAQNLADTGHDVSDYSCACVSIPNFEVAVPSGYTQWGGTPCLLHITSVGDGWYKYEVESDDPSNDTNGKFDINFVKNNYHNAAILQVRNPDGLHSGMVFMSGLNPRINFIDTPPLNSEFDVATWRLGHPNWESFLNGLGYMTNYRWDGAGEGWTIRTNDPVAPGSEYIWSFEARIYLHSGDDGDL